jgi:tRNA pseudouridine38-40 synthase
VPTYRLDLAYDGTGFHGYASQPHQRTVQGELEVALALHTGPVTTVVAGRTDAGVHAAAQVVSFTHLSDLDTERVLRSLNGLLRDEIAVLDLRRVGDEFHARFSATGRSYRYRVLNRPVHDPLLVNSAWHVGDPLDVEAMNQASQPLVGKHDFASFCKKAPGRSTVRVVGWAGWRREGDVVEFSIGANAFCHHMVRSIVALGVEVGRDRLDADVVPEILEAVDRLRIRGAAPARGLTLVGVGYPDEPLRPPHWMISTD